MHDVFYFTDVHGHYTLYKAVMNYCMEKDPECSIIFGGDACDRAPHGYKIMKELLDNPQVLYLKGNHEDMFVRAAWVIQNDYFGEIDKKKIREYLYKQFIADNGDPVIQTYLYNGGLSTLQDWMSDGMPKEFVERINKLPITFSYENIDFCHAGGRDKEFEKVASAEYDELPLDKDDVNMCIWDRLYLRQGWTTGRTCIFGHTPAHNLAAKFYGKDKSHEASHPCSYIGDLDDRYTGRKIDMDVGTAYTDRLYVLNCLTMQARGFKVKDNEVEKIECIQF